MTWHTKRLLKKLVTCKFPVPQAELACEQIADIVAYHIATFSPTKDLQVPHGVRRADDPNREADQRAESATASPQATAPFASAGARGVAPSVSDDSAGTRIPAACSCGHPPRESIRMTGEPYLDIAQGGS